VLLHLVSKRREPMTVTLKIDAPVAVESNMPTTVTLQPEESRTVPAVLRFKADAALPPGATATFTIVADDDGATKQPTTKLLAPAVR
jgi:hypothetical protein